MTVPAPENGVSRQHKHIEFKVVNLSPQNFQTESGFGNLGSDILKFARSELDLREFLLSVTKK